MMLKMLDGGVRGMFCVGQNPTVGSANNKLIRLALAKQVQVRAIKEKDFHAEGADYGRDPDLSIRFCQVQGQGAKLIGAVEGCLANVVGLPLCHVYEALRRAGRAPRGRPERVCQEHFAFRCPVWRHAQAQGHSLRDGDTYATWYRDLPSSVLVGR